jgi:hypothetical protein
VRLLILTKKEKHQLFTSGRIGSIDIKIGVVARLTRWRAIKNIPK